MNPVDAIVIGAGVVGTAIARGLVKAGFRTALIEATDDVGKGTSRANTAILHTGFDATPGSLEARLLRRGYSLMLEHRKHSGIPVERTGAILVAWSDEELERLPLIRENAQSNGVDDTVILSRNEVYQREPNLGDGALGGLRVPGESIICPYTPPLAFATEFVRNGGTLRLNSPVEAIEVVPGGFAVTAGDKRIEGEWIVNAAGLHSDTIDRMLGYDRFTVTPRRGELIVFDKLARSLLSHVILPVPTARTKGVLVSPTVFGNVLLGPTAEDLQDRTDTRTSEAGLRDLLSKGKKIFPALIDEEVTATYAGLRAATEHKDYQIHVDTARRYVCAGGIRSTGLSASLGIAEYVLGLMAETGEYPDRPAPDWRDIRMPYIGENGVRPYNDPSSIARNPDYGRIVCHCEHVTRGEILDALRSDLPASRTDGLKRRTRCLQGRCQGFYCLAEIESLMDEERRP